MIESEETKVNRHPRSLAPARPLASGRCETDEPEKRRHWFRFRAFAVLASAAHGIGGFGTGATPQMADAHGGNGGVGIREPFPCLDGEQFGSVAGLHVMQTPVNVFLSG